MDGFRQCYIKAYVDRTYRVSYQGSDQRVQKANIECETTSYNAHLKGGPSIFITACFVRLLPYKDLPKGTVYTAVWNSAFEARPIWVDKKFGPNDQGTVPLIVGPHGVSLRAQAGSELAPLTRGPSTQANSFSLDLWVPSGVEVGLRVEVGPGGPETGDYLRVDAVRDNGESLSLIHI